MTEQVEKTTKKYLLETRKQSIYPNVDLYSASLYYSLGIPMDLFTPIFAIARISGWTSHVIEEKFAGSLLNPHFIDQRLNMWEDIVDHWAVNIIQLISDLQKLLKNGL